MFKYYNSNLVKKYRSYTVEQICNLFKAKKLHPQTVREWVKNDGLEVISKKPISIYGEVLKDFLEKRNTRHKKHPEFHEIKCVKCGEFVKPKNNEISLSQNKNGSFTAISECSICNNEIRRFYKQIDKENLAKTFTIKKEEVTTLYNKLNSTSKTNINNKENNRLSEPSLKDTNNPCDTASKTNIDTNQLTLFDLP